MTPSDEQIDELLASLDQEAMNYDHWEYGLPTHRDPVMDLMRQMVRAWVADFLKDPRS